MSNLSSKHDGPPAGAAEGATVAVAPRVDVLETEHEFLLVADLPGVRTGDVDIRFERGELTLHGRRQPVHAGKEPCYREYEVPNYHRSFAVSESVAADRISADLKNGVLTVHLPKIEAVKPKRIAVRG